jgi:hypothetical protein
MRIKTVFLCLSISLSVSLSASKAFSKAGDKWFLTHKEFVNLTKSEQKQYLKKTKKVLGAMTDSDYFASRTSKAAKKRGIATEASTPVTAAQISMFITQATQWRGDAKDRVTKFTDPARASENLENYKNSLWWTVMARAALKNLPADDPKRAELSQRLDALDSPKDPRGYFPTHKKTAEKTFAKDGQLTEAYAQMEKAQKGEISFESEKLIPAGSLVDFDSKQVLDLQVAPPATTDETEDVNASAPQPVSVDDVFSQRAPQLGGYRCMYSGFVLKRDPCRGPQSLPDDMRFRGIKTDDLTCDDAQVLCNPILFGLKKDCSLAPEVKEADALACLATAQPLCVPRGKYATKKCGEESSADGYLEAAAALIRMNPDMWTSYMTSFYELCDDKMIVMNEFTEIKDGEPREIPEATLKDVEQTCKNARIQLAKITDQYRNIDSGRPVKPGVSATEGQN